MSQVQLLKSNSQKPQHYTLQFNQFLAKKPSCKFNNSLSHSDFIEAVKDRIKQPHIINQEQVNLCGPNAFFYCIASKYPNHYTKYMLDLWTLGQAYLGKLHVKPSQACLNTKMNSRKIAPVDWIALASLCDSSNSFFNFDDLDDAIGGITFPGDMADWFRKTLFSSVENNTNISHRANFDNLKKAQRFYSANKSVCFLISAKMMTLPIKLNAVPNHWVVLTSNILVDGKSINHIQSSDLDSYLNKKISLHAATWGRKNGKVPLHTFNRKEHLTLADFMTYYYGFVAAS